MSQSTQQVIDLTEDRSSPVAAHIIPPTFTHSEGQRVAQRPPRFDRDIISIDDQEDEAVDLREDSPEIQFLTSRPRSRSLSTARQARNQSSLRQRRHTPATRSPIRPQVSLRITGTPVEARGQQNAGWLFHPFAARVNTHTARSYEEEQLVEWENIPGSNFDLPARLDYLQAGFDLDEPARRQPQPRLPTYNAPSPAQEGFTRTPKEDDVLVCPNCDDELGLGDDEIKRQVWVVKACGHVCTTSSSRLFKLISMLGLLWRVCKEQVYQQEISPLVYVKKDQTILEMRRRGLWEECFASEKCHSGIHVIKNLLCMRGCVFYQSVFSTAKGVGPASRARIVQYSELILQRFRHDTLHCIKSGARDDNIPTITMATYNKFLDEWYGQAHSGADELELGTQEQPQKDKLYPKYTSDHYCKTLCTY